MSFLAKFIGGLAALVHKKQAEEEMDEELRGYLDAAVQENMRSGMSHEQALRVARVEMGSMEAVKQNIRSAGWEAWVETLWQDLRFAVRMLRKNLSFTAAVSITLALGIGATTAIFTVVNGVLFRPLPYPHPEELVYVQMVLNNYPGNAFTYSNDFAAWRERSRTLSQVGAYMFSWFNLTGNGESQRVSSGIASDSFFSLLGARPMLGRLFLPEEDRPSGPPVALLSETLWRTRYKADPSIVGKKGVTLDGKLYTVVGVLPATFVIPDQIKTDYALWVPLAEGAPGTGPVRVVRVIGWLKPGIGMEAARAELGAITQALLQDAVAKHRWSSKFKKKIVLAPWHEQITRGSKLSLLLFLGAVGLLLLIACVNVANLMLSRAATRQKEMAVRFTVGAGRTRLVRQLLTESTLLALLGGLLGIVLAQWGKGLLISFISPNLPALEPIRLDYRVLVFTFALAVVTGLVFGLAPALQSSKVSLNEVLKEAARGTSEARADGLFRSLPIVCETALAMVLLVGSGLLYKSFLRARGIDPGFQSEHILSLTIDLTASKYPTPAAQAAFFEQALEAVKSLEGVQSVAGSNFSPVGNRNGVMSGSIVQGRSDDGFIAFDAVTPDYFRILHIPLLSGRYFDDSDREGAPEVVIVNQAFAHHYFPGESCLGRRLDASFHRKGTMAIVGVVGDVRNHWEREPQPEMYIPSAQVPQPFMVLLVHTPGDPMRLAAAIREQIARIDRDQPPYDLASLDDIRTKSLAPRRVNMLLMGEFGALGLILASVGIFGVVSYSASQRTHEIGVRMALGAERGNVRRFIVWHGLRPVLIGIGIGVAASLGVTRFLQTLLFGVKPTDPITFIAVASILLGVALLATYLPARRATKVDPMVALRYE